MSCTNSKNIVSSAIVSAAVIFCVLDQASAQPPSPAGIEQATREVERAVPSEKIERKMTTPSRKPPEIEEEAIEEEPKGTSFFLEKVQLLGVESLDTEDFDPIIDEYVGREITLPELEALAKKIERKYLKEGFIAACVIPHQDVKSGVVNLQIFEARMGELIINKTKFSFENRLRYYWEPKKGEVLEYAKISRSLQFMNKNPDRYVRATLIAGDEPKTTDIILDPQENFPVHLTLSLDREGAPSTGKLRSGIGFVHNNLLGFDDMLIGGFTGGKDFGGGYVYYKLPITDYGTSIVASYSQTRSSPKKEYSVFEINSRLDNTSVSVHQDLYYKDTYKGEINFGVNASDKGTSWTGGTLIHDKLRTFKLGGLLVEYGKGDITYLRPSFTQGLNMLGARRPSEYTTRGASNVFSKFTLEGGFRKGLIRGLQANISGKAMLAGEKLATQEEMYLGGIDSIRGYPAGDFAADNAFSVTNEILIPASIFLPENFKFAYGANSIGDEITGVLFADYGYGIKRNASDTEISKRKFASAGAGVRIKVFNFGTLRLEWGFPIEGPGDLPLTEFSRSRFHFAFDLQDKVFEELERISKEIKENNIDHQAWAILDEKAQDRDSLLPEKLYGYLHMAEVADKNGDLKGARKNYLKFIRAVESAHRQIKNYLIEASEQLKKLEEYNSLASRYEKQGQYDAATEMWLKVTEQAKLKPLAIEIL
jgi:hemolysin activation/secretion protein